MIRVPSLRRQVALAAAVEHGRQGSNAGAKHSTRLEQYARAYSNMQAQLADIHGGQASLASTPIVLYVCRICLPYMSAVYICQGGDAGAKAELLTAGA